MNQLPRENDRLVDAPEPTREQVRLAAEQKEAELRDALRQRLRDVVVEPEPEPTPDPSFKIELEAHYETRKQLEAEELTRRAESRRVPRQQS